MSPIKASTLVSSPTVKARVGQQNVTRVLSNASSPPAKLIDLNDVNSDDKTDGSLLIWDFLSETFIMGNNIDRNVFISDSTSSISKVVEGSALVRPGVTR